MMMAFSTKLSVPLLESTWTNNAVAIAAAIEVSAEAGRPAQTGTVAAGRHLAAIAEPVLIRGTAEVVPPPNPATFQKLSG